MQRFHRVLLLTGSTILMTTPLTFADEGLWLFNNPPRKLLSERHNFEITDTWLDHLQRASVRFNSGGSGSFISADGLVMTNHHVAADAIQKLSTPENDYLKHGFHAKTLAEEKQCVDLELNVLQSIEDVTKEVNAAVTADMKPTEAFKARRGIISKIEAESEKKTGLRSNVTTLYQGGVYHLYRFQRYTDVRLVFAPEQQIAFFGGDADNFAYPRFDLDCSFFRVYEDGKPAKVQHFLRWSKQGVSDNDLVFVSGHPGRTNRQNTVAELSYLRDVGYPYVLQRLNRWEVMLSVYSGQGEEFERKAKDELFGVANSRKARIGGLAGLQDPALFARKVAEEKRLQDAVAKGGPELKEAAGAWEAIAEAQKVRTQHIKKYTVLEGGAGFNTTLFGIARTLVRAAEEFPKANEQRLSEFAESNKKSLELHLFSEEPIYDDFELNKLGDSLGFLCEQLGYDNELVQKVLAGKSPRERAVQLLQGTKLKDVAERKRLYAGGQKAVDAANDSMLLLAKLVDKDSRELRNIIDAQVEEPKRQAYAKIAKVKFAVEGTNTYPDATFTLRLAFGLVKGYVEDGKKVPFQTTYAGLYEKAKAFKHKPPFDLPERWLKRKDKLDLKTPFNFVLTADIIGGNSGSPVVNRAGEVVGLIFDGNIQSLVWDFAFTDEQARAVAVNSQAMPEALRAVYDAGDLAEEIVTGKRK